MNHYIAEQQKDIDSQYKLAHISDLHLSTLDKVSWKQLLNKRVLGYLSWYGNRQHIHRLDILESLLSDLALTKSNHLIISGDLTHIGTPQEYKQVADWLSRHGSSKQISVVPGNHDCYVNEDPSQTTSLWSSYMQGDNPQEKTDPLFPSFRQRGPVAIIGLSTALPTAPFFATGKLGHDQIDMMKPLLEKARSMGLFRIVVLHHGPLETSNKFRKRLVDAKEFRSALSSVGAELILHGHGHHPITEWFKFDGTDVPVIGAPSASQLSSSEHKRAGYNTYHVERTDEGWQLTVSSRRYEEATGTFADTESRKVHLPARN